MVAMDEFNKKTSSAGDNYGGLIVLKATGSPHSIIWENRFVPLAYQIKMGCLFIIFLVLYLFLITKIMDFSRFYFESHKFLYDARGYCDELVQQFGDDKELFNKWAEIDGQYLKNGEMVGYYECYCTPLVSITNVW